MNPNPLKETTMSNIPLTEQAADAANQALQATRTLANNVLHDASSGMHRGAETLRENALKVSDTTSDYIKHDPIKSVLIAAATGAVLMGLISLISRPHHRS